VNECKPLVLGDQNELTQEMASRGVSVVYDLGTEEQRKTLLASLMGTLSGEKKKNNKVKLAAGADTRPLLTSSCAVSITGTS